MTTDQTLNKIHSICFSFPKMKFNASKVEQSKPDDQCFAYSRVLGNSVYLSIRVPVVDLIKAFTSFKIWSLNWSFSRGLWVTICLSSCPDWTKVKRCIEKSYCAVTHA